MSGPKPGISYVLPYLPLYSDTHCGEGGSGVCGVGQQVSAVTFLTRRVDNMDATHSGPRAPTVIG